jgi:hypothetical protein
MSAGASLHPLIGAPPQRPNGESKRLQGLYVHTSGLAWQSSRHYVERRLQRRRECAVGGKLKVGRAVSIKV